MCEVLQALSASSHSFDSTNHKSRGEEISLTKLRQITDWVAKKAGYHTQREASKCKLAALKDERLRYLVPAADGDRGGRTELDRLDTEIAALERQAAELQGAEEQADVQLTQQRERDAAETERKRQAECARLTGELLQIDQRADTALAQLRAALDARKQKLQQLKPLLGTGVIRILSSHPHVACVVKRGLYPHVIVETVGRCDETLAELDSKLLRSRSGETQILEEAV